MSYQPPSQPGDEPAKPAEGYTPPPPPSGEATPPPTYGGGYEPPPPPAGGGYTPPPSYGGGYDPAPTALSTPGGGKDLNFGALMQSYINAVTKPNAAYYEGEIANASWAKTLIGVAIVAIISTLIGFVAVGLATAEFDNQINQLRAQGDIGSETVIQWLQFLRDAVYYLTIGGLVFTFVTFFLGTAIQYMTARMLGGQGSDFMTQSYLSSLSYVPLRIVSTLLSIVPFVGGLVSSALSIYQIVCVGFSLQASQRMQPGRAMLAAFVPLILTILLACTACIVLFFVIAAAAGNAGR